MAVDMEGPAIRRLARDHQIRFLVARTVSDLVDEDLPIDLNLFLSSLLWFQGVANVLRRPGVWYGFSRPRKQMVVASRQLTWFFELFLCQLVREGFQRADGI